jgi:hypothetical protein
VPGDARVEVDQLGRDPGHGIRPLGGVVAQAPLDQVTDGRRDGDRGVRVARPVTGERRARGRPGQPGHLAGEHLQQ